MVLMKSEQKLNIGDKAPEFDLLGTDENHHSLNDYRGKKAFLIIFMCNHCPYVIPKLKQYVSLQKRYPQIQFIGINANESENYPEDSFENMKKVKLNFPYLFDDSQDIARAYGAVCTPDPFLFDEEMKLVYHGRFDDKHGEEGNSADMIDAIEAALKGAIVEEQKPSMGCSIKWKGSF